MKTPRIPVMLATTVDKPFDSEEYVFELKFDGYRALANIEGGKVDLYSRNHISFNDKYPSLVEELSKIKENILIDGEIIAHDKNGKASFQVLQRIGEEKDAYLEYVVFDLLYFDGQSVMDEPLLKRKDRLEKLLKKYPNITYSSHVEDMGKAFFQEAVKLGMEGVIAKKKSSSYLPGRRSDSWLKIKNHKTDEAVIVGFTEPRGSRKQFGALLLAQYRAPDELKFIGRTGTGFTDYALKDLYEKLKPLIVKTSPIDDKISIKAPITWVKPKLVAQFKFTEWTTDGIMRHPVFLGLREDKEGDHVRREETIKTDEELAK